MAQYSTTAPSTSTSAFSIASLFGVHGRKIVVTGGGSGLGSYAALAYALHGATVYIVGRRMEKLESVKADFEKRKTEQGADPTAKDGKIIPLKGDVSSKDSVKALVEAYGKHESYLDVLVNGAGIINQAPKADKDDGDAVVKALFEDDWDSFANLYNVNVIGLIYNTLAFAPYLAKAKPPSLHEPGPSVINISSIAGHHIARTMSMAYQASKASASRVSQLLAGRLMPLKIRSNEIAPGVFPSEMTKAEKAEDYLDESHPFHAMVKANPIGRSGTPEDFAGLCLFLASRAGAYMNGGCIVIDGGRLLTQSAA